MIGYLRGQILSVDEEGILLDVNQVGYVVHVPTTVLSEAQAGETIHLHIHTHVREDAITLYGFTGRDDLVFFRQLISVSGIGPKLGIGVLGFSAHVVRLAIADGDEAILSRIPGIGKKTAARIILDLKNKVIVSNEAKPRAVRSSYQDAYDALANLGYDRGMITRVLDGVPENLESTEEIVKFFLQNA